MAHKLVDFQYQRYVTVSREANNYESNHKITEKFHSNSWLGEVCFIVAGGESLNKFNFSAIEKFKVITINLGFLYCASSINYSMDSKLYDKIVTGELNKRHNKPVDAMWRDYKGVKCFINPLESKQFGSDVLLVRRIRDLKISRNIEEGIHAGRNSALGALMLAIVLGAKEIYLLGFDMKCKNQTHFHAGYDSRDLVDFNTRLSQFKLEFENTSPLIGQKEIQIFNCNSQSELKCFPFCNMDKILEKYVTR